MTGLKSARWLFGFILLVSASGAVPAIAAIPEGSTFVALGSSFAAGPGITTPAADSPPLCGQSTDNYARQLARRLKLKLVDRSCGGAVTADVVGVGPLHRPAQVEGLTPDTRLVTVTIGGNDVRYMNGLAAGVCHKQPDAFSGAMRERVCATPSDFQLDAAFQVDEAGLRAIAAAVHQTSPQARLVFVDYVTVLPQGSTCAILPMSDADADELRARADRLARLTAKVARETGSGLIKTSELSRGHDACAADPWANGYFQKEAPTERAPVPFHPRLPAMTAITDALEGMLVK